MIASVLHLSRADCKALNIKDAYSLHRVVYDLFDDVRSESEKQQAVSSGILYVDKGGDFRGRKILMLSNRQPNAPIHGEISMKKIANDFLDYSDYRFEIVINPTKRQSGGGKLVPLRTREDIANWFLEKAPQWGFDVSKAHLQVEDIAIKCFSDKHGHEITQAQARILGRLTVTDKMRFTKSFQQGIGRGRSFGCGLLQVVPI